MVTRCSWAEHDELRAYHDEEWGVPVHGDDALFELLTLEGAQAGLSWLIVLRRRAGYRAAFADFDPAAVANFSSGDVDRLVEDPGIIRHRGKIESVVSNAAAVLEVQQAGGSLDELLWSFVGGHPWLREWPADDPLPASTPEAAAMSKELRRRGFRFVGPVTCYALMQAAGLVNDHHPTCFRREQLA
ncbi:MAG TPA: DNA-3-methyladenine glycosylase I, partial [Acidimicrobiales bacterium]